MQNNGNNESYRIVMNKKTPDKELISRQPPGFIPVKRTSIVLFPYQNILERVKTRNESVIL